MNAPTPPVTPPIIVGRSITYELTRRDVFLGSLTLLLRQWLLVVFIVGVFAFDLAARTFLMPRGDKTTEEVVVTVLVKWLWMLVGIHAWIVLCAVFGAYISKKPGVICEHTLGIRPDGLIERTHVNETLHPWTSVRRVVSLFGYVYIYIALFNSHIVPKRSVAPDVLEGFLAEVRERMAR